MKTYKYELQKGSKHILCPICQKKTFKPYVHTGTNNVVDELKYGRCERINSCSYILYPDNDDSEWQDYEPIKQPYIAPKPDFISPDLVRSTFRDFNKNVFFNFLAKTFDLETARALQVKYNIGTAKHGGTIFWQKDRDGKFRTGKVFYYQGNGKRDKQKGSWYLHKQVNKDYRLVQVFFGEHLITEEPTKPIALCESEKSAILMSVLQPEYNWLAAGGSNMLNVQRLMRLHRLDLVSPDEGQFELWEKQTAFFKGRQMDIRVEKAFREGKVNGGDDILDLYLNEKLLTK